MAANISSISIAFKVSSFPSDTKCINYLTHSCNLYQLQIPGLFLILVVRGMTVFHFSFLGKKITVHSCQLLFSLFGFYEFTAHSDEHLSNNLPLSLSHTLTHTHTHTHTPQTHTHTSYSLSLQTHTHIKNISNCSALKSPGL